MGDQLRRPGAIARIVRGNMRVNGDRNLGGEGNRVQFVVCTSNIDAVHTARPWRHVGLASTIGVASVSSGCGDNLHAEGGPNPHLAYHYQQGSTTPDLDWHGGTVTAVTASRAEGIVAKRRDRRIDPGGSPDWIKIKNPNAPAATRILEW